MIKQEQLVLINKTTPYMQHCLNSTAVPFVRANFVFGLLLYSTVNAASCAGTKASSNVSVVGSTSHLTNDSTLREQRPRNRAPGFSACPKEPIGHLGQREPKEAGGVVVVCKIAYSLSSRGQPIVGSSGAARNS
jgi:hypothetical protein